jgi:hypothetical protein
MDDDGVKGLIVLIGVVFIILLNILPPAKKRDRDDEPKR